MFYGIDRAVRRMRTRIGLLAQLGSMRSIVGATQRQQRLGLALNWCVSGSGVHLGLYNQSNPTLSVCSALSEPEPPQQSNNHVIVCQSKHDCIDAQACGSWRKFKPMITTGTWGLICHSRTLKTDPAGLNRVYSDSASTPKRKVYKT